MEDKPSNKIAETGARYEPEGATPLFIFGQVHIVVHPLAMPSNVLNKPETETDHRPT